MKQKTIIAPESKTKKAEIHESEDSQTDAPLAYQRLASHRRALQRYEAKRQFTSPVEELAQNISGMVGNVKFPGADEAYPLDTQALFRFCSKVYPNAVGGPLYVDYPKNEVEIYRAYERTKVMKKLKIRHVIIESDSTLEHLLEQLGEL
jgi:hypothetical protein